jgi:hypothetical protein
MDLRGGASCHRPILRPVEEHKHGCHHSLAAQLRNYARRREEILRARVLTR